MTYLNICLDSLMPDCLSRLKLLSEELFESLGWDLTLESLLYCPLEILKSTPTDLET